MSSESHATRIGFIGAGRMATALAGGLIRSEFVPAENVIASDVAEEIRARFAAETGAAVTESNPGVAAHADVIILAVKPQQITDVLNDIRTSITPDHLVVSIAAGVSLASIAAVIGEDRRMIRVMPNTPCLVGACAAAFSPGGTATPADAEFVERMLSVVGVAVGVPEPLLDAVTGLSGSGPAYVYQVIEALSDGGVRVGLPRDVALKLAAQTVLGAAKMVLETGEHPGVLKDAVTSPGGTTIAGLHALERGGLRACLIDAVEAAAARSRELGESS